MIFSSAVAAFFSTNAAPFILGIIGGLLTNFIWQKWRDAVEKNAAARFSQKVSERLVHLSADFKDEILLLDSAGTHYLAENISVQVDEDLKFLVPCQADDVRAIAEAARGKAKPTAIAFEKDFVVPRGLTVEAIGSSMGIDHFRERLIAGSRATAERFVESYEKPGRFGEFNGKSFFLRGFTRARDPRGGDERTTFFLALGMTDWFTGLTLYNVYHQLAAEGHGIVHADESSISEKYNWFIRGFGVNVLAILHDGGKRYVVFSKRSGNLYNMRGKSRWHVTTNEGLTGQDLESDGRLDLYACAERGLREENGIELRPMDAIRFYSFFFLRTDFELGILGSAELRLSQAEFSKQARALARDNTMEIRQYAFVEFTERAIQEFYRRETEAGEEFTASARLGIEIVSARNGLNRLNT